MKTIILSALVGCFLVACAERYMPPARAISAGGEQATLCKETYLQCRHQCAGTKHEETRLSCSEQCERDVDTCLMQARAD